MKHAIALLLLALPRFAADPYPRACVDCHNGSEAPKVSAVMNQ